MTERIPVLPDIVERHADGASFLWLLRSRAAGAPHYSLMNLAHLDGRVEAHLDGLRVAGEEGWEIARDTLKLDEPDDVFPLAILAFETGRADRMRHVLAAAADAKTARGLISALGWIEWARVEPLTQRLLASEVPAERRVGIAAYAIHRRDPGEPLLQAIADGDLLLRARGLRAAGELGRLDLLPTLRRHLGTEDPACRFAAAWSAARLSAEPQATTTLREVAEKPGRFRREACGLALRRLKPDAAQGWWRELAGDPAMARLAVIGAGVFGDPGTVPWLIERMAIPELARPAGESFSLLTGADLSFQDLDGNKPKGFKSGPTEDPTDEDVELDPDLDLPWPDPVRVAAWWETRSGAITRGRRYLLGEPISPDSLAQALRRGTQRQRGAAALELALLDPAKPLFEVRAPGARQQLALAGSG